MSVQTRSPLRMAGANLSTQNVNTGELPTIRGGMQAGTIYSGMPVLSGVALAAPAFLSGFSQGFDLLLASGAGRFNSWLALTQSGGASGVGVVFYDAATATSGGPFPLSGHKVVSLIPQSFAVLSGTLVLAPGFNGQPANVDFPFQSGLCVALKPGQLGFTYSWTPEVNAASGTVQN